MKKLILVMLAVAGMLSGCVAYDPHPGPRDGAYRDHDRDGDGIRNRDDARPNNPSRY